MRRQWEKRDKRGSTQRGCYNNYRVSLCMSPGMRTQCTRRCQGKSRKTATAPDNTHTGSWSPPRKKKALKENFLLIFKIPQKDSMVSVTIINWVTQSWQWGGGRHAMDWLVQGRPVTRRTSAQIPRTHIRRHCGSYWKAARWDGGRGRGNPLDWLAG